jgi:hypothetical protein
MPYSRSASNESPSLAAEWPPPVAQPYSSRSVQDSPDDENFKRLSARGVVGPTARAGIARGCSGPYNPVPPGDWCIGNTVVSKTATRGSTPRSPARAWPRKSGLWLSGTDCGLMVGGSGAPHRFAGIPADLKVSLSREWRHRAMPGVLSRDRYDARHGAYRFADPRGRACRAFGRRVRRECGRTALARAVAVKVIGQHARHGLSAGGREARGWRAKPLPSCFASALSIELVDDVLLQGGSRS